ncbi:MAG: hypothetical protein V2J24_11460 [Pseudomonadales bacterium]|jgi:hypothetical protein|nr:hypothetical protein [Pseudomonadales bacterium]
MRRYRFLLGMLTLVTAYAAAEEQLTLPTPDGWATVSTLATPFVRMSAFAIPGEGPDGVDKLSFEWFARELAADTDPFSLVEQVAGTIRGNCRGGSDQPVFAGEENGYPTVVRLLLCPRLNGTEPPRGELLMLKAVEGRTGFWIVVRGRDLSATTAPGSTQLRTTIGAWSNALRTITLCDPDDPAHPCPAEEP